MYYEFEAGEQVYKLRLTTRAIIQLEAVLGKNPLMVFSDGELPRVTDMCAVLHAALQDQTHGMTMEKTYKVFDEYLQAGHTPSDFVSVMIEIYRVSGLLEGGEEKN